MNLRAPNNDEDQLYRASHNALMVIVNTAREYWATTKDPVPDFRVLRSYISSPRIEDVYLKEFSDHEYVKVGLSYLDERTMLCDNPEKTIAMSLPQWVNKAPRVTILEEPTRNDNFVRVQVWTFDAHMLKDEQLDIAVMLSFTDRELSDPRIGQAVNEIARKHGFRCD